MAIGQMVLMVMAVVALAGWRSQIAPYLLIIFVWLFVSLPPPELHHTEWYQKHSRSSTEWRYGWYGGFVRRDKTCDRQLFFVDRENAGKRDETTVRHEEIEVIELRNQK